MARTASRRCRADPREIVSNAAWECVMTVLDHVYQQLSADARRVYQVLGALPSLPSVGVAEVAAAATMPLAATSEALQDLARCGLVERHEPDADSDHVDTEDGCDGHGTRERFRVPAGVLEHAIGQAESLGERDRASVLRCWVNHLLSTASRAGALAAPDHHSPGHDQALQPDAPDALVSFSEPGRAWVWLEDHFPILVAAARTAHWNSWWDLAWRIVACLSPLERRLERDELWGKLCLDVAAQAARSAGDQQVARLMVISGTDALRRLGRYDDVRVHLYRVLYQARTDKDRAGEAAALQGLGDVARVTGLVGEAEALHRKALALREEAGEEVAAAISRIRLGELARLRSETPAAHDLLTGARTELVAANSPHEAARALAFLARTHHQAGEHDQAQALLRHAAGEFAGCGSVLWQARALEWSGEFDQEYGDHDAARASYREALAVYDRRSPLEAVRIIRVLRELDRPTAPGAQVAES
ncbi:helix-turn-helix domain-containing protein [Streptomyces hainanensis]|uniref:Tetratricopeptide repeat protein n=1 Tax=Streptomyces hainanensis TaxID=402648 RepID=A0A4R4TIQ5_9ACTN|nr:helix-turn-helix domain-containing protein [Streptomyces hainanensis]TDC77500.1 tetratricopeptide repeat protein [Streptomyces hainanensis]